MMDIKEVAKVESGDLKIFQAVAREGNITKAPQA